MKSLAILKFHSFTFYFFVKIVVQAVHIVSWSLVENSLSTYTAKIRACGGVNYHPQQNQKHI